MKLTRASSYAFSALAHLASQTGDQPVTSASIAKERDLPERFLLKVLKPLVDSRVLKATKGPHGGYKLGRTPAEINLLEVVEAVDGKIVGDVPDGSLPGLDLFCREKAESLRDSLRQINLADLLSQGK